MSHISVEKIILTNFRNYERLEVDVLSRINIITGNNGAGKTNLLEAVSLLASGKGIRSAKIEELSKYDSSSNDWSIFASVNTPDGIISIGTGRANNSENNKRIVKIDGKIMRSQNALAKYFSICWLTPKMDQIFNDGQSSRRKYLDKLTGLFYPDHTKHLSIYNYARTERQKLLDRNNPDYAWVAILEKRMSEQAIAIAAARLEVIDILQRAINSSTASSFLKPILSVSGDIEQSLESMTAINAEQQYCDKLKQARANDSANGRTSCGTHKSDFLVIHPDKKLSAEFCSTGEQKAMLLSITLATVRAAKSWHGRSPVLLLDEVIAHLDNSKRSELFAEIEELQTQCWLTGTDISCFEQLNNKACFLSVENAVVKHSQSYNLETV